MKKPFERSGCSRVTLGSPNHDLSPHIPLAPVFPHGQGVAMTRLLSTLACLLATIALSPMPGQAQTTRVQFDLFTRDDDLREDSAASYELELDDGRIVVGGQVVGRLADRTHTYPTFDLPPGI